MPTIEFNAVKGVTEHVCDTCGNIVPWSETTMFGECKECAAESEGKNEE